MKNLIAALLIACTATAARAAAPDGMTLYQDRCAACHGVDGKGEPPLTPALAGSALLTQAGAGSAMRIILEGARAASTNAAPTAPAMPSFAWRFNDGEVAAILTYVRSAWGNKANAVTADSVAKARASLQADRR